MIIIEIIIFSVVLYFLIVFLLSRMVVPHLGFIDDKIPEIIPDSMAKKVDELKNLAGNPEKFLKLDYDYIGSKYKTGRINTFLKLGLLFKNIDEIWQREGYIPCHQSNLLLKIFLVRSGFFKDEEIKRKHTVLNFCLHQYLLVRVNDKWVDVDVGEKQRGMPIGRHMKYFG